MNKTALQQLIDKWVLDAKVQIYDIPLIYQDFIKDAESFLEIEKQQIIDAHNSAGGGDDCWNGKDYFEKNFNSTVSV